MSLVALTGQLTFICSKSTIETLEKGVQFVLVFLLQTLNMFLVFLSFPYVSICFKSPKFCLKLKVISKNNVHFNVITRRSAILGLIWLVIFLDILIQFKSHQIISCTSLPRLPWATFFPFPTNLLFCDVTYFRISISTDDMTIPRQTARWEDTSVVATRPMLSLRTSVETISTSFIPCTSI